jgi:hypothetical protein
MHSLPQTSPPLSASFLIDFHDFETNESSRNIPDESPDKNDDEIAGWKKVLPRIPLHS